MDGGRYVERRRVGGGGSGAGEQRRFCRRCGQIEPYVEITTDHVVPRSLIRTVLASNPSLAGSLIANPVNHQDLCRACNQWKGSAWFIDYRGDDTQHRRLVRLMRRHGIHVRIQLVYGARRGTRSQNLWAGQRRNRPIELDAACCVGHRIGNLGLLEDCREQA